LPVDITVPRDFTAKYFLMVPTELNKTFTNFPMSLTQLHLEIVDTSIAILTSQHHQCRVQERGGDQMTLIIAMIVITVIFMIITVALILAMKCQQQHQRFEAPTGIAYRVSLILNFNHLVQN
jgi:hypothetical protein